MPERCLRIYQGAWLNLLLACKDSPDQEEKGLGAGPASVQQQKDPTARAELISILEPEAPVDAIDASDLEALPDDGQPGVAGEGAATGTELDIGHGTVWVNGDIRYIANQFSRVEAFLGLVSRIQVQRFCSNSLLGYAGACTGVNDLLCLDVFTEANNQREKRKMLKTLTMGLSLSLLSLSAWALPDTIDVSGVEIGSDMQEAVNQLQEKYPEEEVKVYSFEDGGIGRIVVHQNYNNKWEIRPVPDGSGRVGYIARRQGFDDNNVGLEATLEALRNKYGQEVFQHDRNHEWYWVGFTDDAPDDFEIDNARNAMGSASLLYQLRGFNKERTENIRAYVHVKIQDKQGGDLVHSMETTVYWVEPAHDHAIAYLEEQRAIKEAEEQRNLEEAVAADI